MLNNYVWEVAGDVHLQKLQVELCTEGEGHGKDVGHNLDDVYDQVQKNGCDGSDEEQEVDSYVVVLRS